MGLKAIYEAIPKDTSPRTKFVESAAKECGVSVITVYRWIKGTTHPKLAHKVMLAKLLNCRPDEL